MVESRAISGEYAESLTPKDVLRAFKEEMPPEQPGMTTTGVIEATEDHIGDPYARNTVLRCLNELQDEGKIKKWEATPTTHIWYR